MPDDPKTTPCPDGEDCPDARRYGAIHPKPGKLSARLRLEITSEMHKAGMTALREICERHGFGGLMGLPFVHNLTSEIYFAMRRAEHD